MSPVLSAPFLQALAENEMFEGVSPGGVAASLRIGRRRKFSPRQTVFRQGEPATRAHVLVTGLLRIGHVDRKGAQLLVRFIRPGEIFGTIGLLTDQIYPAWAVAAANSIEVSWAEKDLFRLIDAYPKIAINLIKITGRRLAEAQQRLQEVGTQPVERRVANVIWRLTRQAGRATPAGTCISFPVTRKDIAEMCGATLHSVSRTLSGWEKAEFLKTDNKLITIYHMDEIVGRAQGN